MKLKLLIVFALFLFVGCASNDLDKKDPGPDRGKIQYLDPTMPPSLTNEWSHITR